MKKRQPRTVDISNSELVKLVSKNIKNIRLKNDISQETLAELAELHRNSICMIENGQSNMTLTTIENIAKALKIDAYELFVIKNDN